MVIGCWYSSIQNDVYSQVSHRLQLKNGFNTNILGILGIFLIPLLETTASSGSLPD
jgi:hypothetical protein